MFQLYSIIKLISWGLSEMRLSDRLFKLECHLDELVDLLEESIYVVHLLSTNVWTAEIFFNRGPIAARFTILLPILRADKIWAFRFRLHLSILNNNRPCQCFLRPSNSHKLSRWLTWYVVQSSISIHSLLLPRLLKRRPERLRQDYTANCLSLAFYALGVV